jgi:hypothetical protein
VRDRPFALFGAAAVQSAEAAGVCVASVLSAIDTAEGKAYQLGSGIALTVIGFCTVAALAWVAVGLAQGRRWAWMPALLTQLFTLITGIYLLQSHRYDWGAPAVVLPVAAAVLLLLPASLDKFGRRPTDEHSGRRPSDEHGGRRPSADADPQPAPAKARPIPPKAKQGAKAAQAKARPAPVKAGQAKGRPSRPRSGRP